MTRHQMTDDEVDVAYKLLIRWAHKLKVNDADVEDMVHDALLAYVAKFGRIRSEHRVIALRRVLLDACRAYWKKIDREPILGMVIRDGNDVVHRDGAVENGKLNDAAGWALQLKSDANGMTSIRISVKDFHAAQDRAHDSTRDTRDPMSLFREAGLTERQIEICLLSIDGLNAVEIGPLLGISPVTVRTTMMSVRRKLREVID